MKNEKKLRLKNKENLSVVFVLLLSGFLVGCNGNIIEKKEKKQKPTVTDVKCLDQDCMAPLCEEVKGLETDGTPKKIPDNYNGAIKVCSDNGRLFTFYEVKNGEIDGEMLLYDENGILGQRITFVNGKKEGVSATYDSKGTLIKTETFHNGKKIN